MALELLRRLTATLLQLRVKLEMPDDQRDDYQADAPRTPVDRGNASPVECFSPQAMAVLEARRKELDHERLTVEELRRQLKQDVHRLRSVGMTREQALLQEAGVALDSRVSALNRALAEHRVIHQTLQGSLEQIRSKAHGDTGGDATPVTGVGATAGRHERYEIPFKTEDLGLLQRWQRILGHELGEPSRRTKSPHSRARGARSNSPLSSRRSRSYREAVDHHLNWLQNFSRQAGPLTARNYSGW
ncbi:unnamed protein product [Durusdinium trenchii]|uniref:Uncharacterized protein n=1 Tax=Durusdinium trenchii TaxID=1381693 RepID=A0ABP0PNA4_9DINO